MDVLYVKNMKLIVIVSIAALALLNTACGAETPPAHRSTRWAKPIQIEGIPNLHKVSDTLNRSAQPLQKA